MLSRTGLFLIIFSLSLVLSGGLSSCKNMKKFKEDRAQLLSEKEERRQKRKDAKNAKNAKADVLVEVVVPEEPILVEEIVEKKAEGDSLYLSYERTACYGRCPIYKITIYDSGFTTYEGINFVAKMGMYHSHLDETTLIDLETTLNDMYFFQLKDSYDNPSLSDLPSKIVMVNIPNHKKRIKARYEVPVELVNLFDKIDGIIDATTWLPGMVKK